MGTRAARCCREVKALRTALTQQNREITELYNELARIASERKAIEWMRYLFYKLYLNETIRV